MAARSGGDGKRLENLVATIERLLVPQGFTVEKNEREYDEDGTPVGEFDITIRGKIGSAPIACLIECRNRPSEGPAPGAWIQQLVGRRSQFGFHSVVAVSTTGFSPGAVACATKERIELREMSQLQQLAPDLAAWLSTRVLHSQEVRHWLTKAGLQIGAHEPAEREQAVTAVVTTTSSKDPLLRSTRTQEIISVVDAFQGAVQALPHLYAGVLPNQPAKHVTFNCNFTNDDDHYVVDTTEGPVRITSIYFEGDLSIHQTDIPLAAFSDYRARGNKDPVAQTATFTFPVKGQTVTLNLHHLKGTGATYATVRHTGAAPTDASAKTKKS